MRKFYLIIAILLFFLLARAQNSLPYNLESYAQIRFTTDFVKLNNFQLRRLKFKLTSTPKFLSHWSYYLKFEVKSKNYAIFSLLDARIAYKIDNITFYLGQFLPDFSLQRFQSDSKIPTIERQSLVSNFIPNAGLGKRDVGIQAFYLSENKLFYTSLGVFNGTGTKQWNFNNNSFLTSHKSFISINKNSNFKLKTGYSLMYRYAQNLKFKTILPDSIYFTGKDIRVNAFLQFSIKNFVFQTEYIKLWLNSWQTDGFYFLTYYTLRKHQFVFSYEKLQDLNTLTKDLPQFYIGYNYLIDNNDLKISLAYTWQINNRQIQNSFLSIQLQIFLIRPFS